MYRRALTAIDLRIQEARGRCDELGRLRARRARIAEELAAAEADVAARSRAVVKEEADVAALGGGLWAFVRDVFFDSTERLAKEEAEAAAARARFQEAIAHHRHLRDALADTDASIVPLAGAEDALAAARAAKLDELEARGGAIADELAALDAEAAAVHARLVQLDEALAAGDSVRTTLARLDARLAEAERWHGTDLLLGSRAADVARAQRQDNARNLVGVAQAELAMFRRELADVGLAMTDDLAVSPHVHGPTLIDAVLGEITDTVTLPAFVLGARDVVARVAAAVEQALVTLRARRAADDARGRHLDRRLAELTDPA